MLNLSKNANYNQSLFWISKIPKRFLPVYSYQCIFIIFSLQAIIILLTIFRNKQTNLHWIDELKWTKLINESFIIFLLIIFRYIFVVYICIKKKIIKVRPIKDKSKKYMKYMIILNLIPKYIYVQIVNNIQNSDLHQTELKEVWSSNQHI